MGVLICGGLRSSSSDLSWRRVRRLLKLDLVVRDDQGNIVNPDLTSAVKLYRHHQQAASRGQDSEVRADRAAQSVPTDASVHLTSAAVHMPLSGISGLWDPRHVMPDLPTLA